jgi:hypothetical protein
MLQLVLDSKIHFMFWKGKKETREKRNQSKPDRGKKREEVFTMITMQGGGVQGTIKACKIHLTTDSY